jgi:hypothetical protein
MASTAELVQLTVRVLCDRLPADGPLPAYLFAQTPDNQSSVLAAGRELLIRGSVRELRFAGCDAFGGYPGARAWRQALLEMGVAPESIAEVPVNIAAGLNTRIEAEALVRVARQRGDRRLLVIAPPFQQVRAFMSVVRCVVASHPRLRAYSHVGMTQRWTERVSHSQGSLQAPRSALVGAELERIERYTRKGDLIAVREVLDYLDRREAEDDG